MWIEGFDKKITVPIETARRHLRTPKRAPAQQPTEAGRPNRAARRAALARAPRDIRLLAREARRWNKLHWLAPEKWLDPEELATLRGMTPEIMVRVRKHIKNVSKAARHETR